jgi:hypothetical protein
MPKVGGKSNSWVARVCEQRPVIYHFSFDIIHLSLLGTPVRVISCEFVDRSWIFNAKKTIH